MEVQKPIRALTAAAAGCCLSLAEEEAPDNKCPQFTAFTMTQAKSKRQITRADLLRPTRARSDPLITSAQPHLQCPAPGAAAPRPCWERGAQGRPPRLAAPCRLLGQPGGFGCGGAGGAGFSSPGQLPCAPAAFGAGRATASPPARPEERRERFASLLLQRFRHSDNLIIAFSARCHLGVQWQLLSSGERLQLCVITHGL